MWYISILLEGSAAELYPPGDSPESYTHTNINILYSVPAEGGVGESSQAAQTLRQSLL